MTDDAILLSIVIPTRNREKYAMAAMRAILGSAMEDFELVVQDNSDSDVLAQFARQYSDDHRLRYSKIRRTISAVDNFNMGVRQALGTFVSVIGDDDLVNPEIVAACRWAQAVNCDAIITDRHRALYYWPDFRSADSGDAESASLKIYEFSSRVEWTDPEEELRKCVLTAGISLQRLPRVYLGVVRRTCLERTYQKVGTSQIGTCPDMFYAVATASHTSRIAVLDYPLVIPGASAPSTAGAVRMREHEGQLESAPHLRGRPNYMWTPLIPRFYSLQTFYAESALLGLRATGREDLIRVFNFPFLYLLSALFHRDRIRETLTAIRYFRAESEQTRPGFAMASMFALVRVFWMLLKKRWDAKTLRPGVTPLSTVIHDLSDSVSSTNALLNYLRGAGATFRATPIAADEAS
jgi:Glycosyltransferases involved in cell wall biogenesis